MPKQTGKASENYGTIYQYDDKIRYYHSVGLTRYAIAKQLGFDPSSINKRAIQLGLQFQHDKIEDYTEEIIAMRQQGFSVRHIANKMGCTHPTISALLKKHDISTEKFKIGFDESFFESIDNEEKAYCLGIMLSDGYVQHGRIAVTMTDLDVIEKFKRCVKYEGRIREIPPEKPHHKIKYEINLYSVKMYRDIKKYGVIPNKSLTLKFPEKRLIPDDLLYHMIRGIHDGDGCITLDTVNNKWIIAFTGTLEVLQGIEKYSRIKGYYEYIGEEDANTWQWRIRKQSDIVNMLEWMYKDTTVYMDRKKKKADECLLDLKSRLEENK